MAPSTSKHSFAVEATGDPIIWAKMNIHLHLYSFDEAGTQSSIQSGENDPAVGKASSVRVETPVPTNEMALCLYVVPRGLPESNQVSDSPPLTLTLRVWRDGELIDTLQRTINRFGGDQLINQRYR